MKPFLFALLFCSGLCVSACAESGTSCDDLDCNDRNACTENSCNPDGPVCESVPVSDWSRCDLDAGPGFCGAGVCALLEWSSDYDEQQRIKAECESRSIAECEEDARCGNLWASRLDENLVCSEVETQVGCTIVFRFCGQRLTTAENPDGELFNFPDTCLPKGWTDADDYLRLQSLAYAGGCEWTQAEWPTGEERQSIREECEKLDQDHCYFRAECRVIDPWRVDENRMCLELLSGQGRCTSRFRVCDTTPTLAVSPEGEEYVFGNDCVLESWQVTGSIDGAQSHVFAWPTCAARP